MGEVFLAERRRGPGAARPEPQSREQPFDYGRGVVPRLRGDGGGLRAGRVLHHQ